MITLIVGNIPFLQDQALRRVKQAWGDCDVRTFFGPEAKAVAIIEACQTLSLLNASSAAVVRHAEGLPKKEQEILLLEIGRLSDEAMLVLMADKIDKRLKFWQTLVKKAQKVSAESPPIKTLRSWFQQEMKRRNLLLDEEAIEQLLAVARENFAQALLLLDRVQLYRLGATAISGSDVAACRVSGEAAQIFAWSDAVAEGQWQRAFAILQGLWSHHEEPLVILALLVRHFRILFKAREHQSLWGRSGELARILAVPPFVVEKYCQQSKRYRRRQLWQVWNELLETDRALKSSPVPRRLILEDLVWRLKQIAA